MIDLNIVFYPSQYFLGWSRKCPWFGQSQGPSEWKTSAPLDFPLTQFQGTVFLKTLHTPQVQGPAFLSIPAHWPLTDVPSMGLLSCESPSLLSPSERQCICFKLSALDFWNKLPFLPYLAHTCPPTFTPNIAPRCPM